MQYHDAGPSPAEAAGGAAALAKRALELFSALTRSPPGPGAAGAKRQRVLLFLTDYARIAGAQAIPLELIHTLAELAKLCGVSRNDDVRTFDAKVMGCFGEASIPSHVLPAYARCINLIIQLASQTLHERAVSNVLAKNDRAEPVLAPAVAARAPHRRISTPGCADLDTTAG